MKPEQTTLSNGLQILTADMPGAFSATVSVVIGIGSRYEKFDTNGGVSHFLEHLLFKGTEKRPSAEAISIQIDAVGGWNNAYTSAELTNYYVKVPYQKVELGLDILADMVRNPLLDPEEIDRERDVILEEMNVYRDDPASYVHQLTPELLWPAHPLAQKVLGNEDVIRKIQKDEIADYMNKYYVPEAMAVVVAGRVDHAAVVEQAKALFGDMKSKKPLKAASVSQVLNGPTVSALTKDTAQAHLAIATIGYPYRHADDPAAKVIGTILGRGMSSRLFINVRERKGLAYSISAGSENYTDTGEFEVYAGVSVGKQAEAIEAIIEELDRMAHEVVKEVELEKAKQQIIGGLQMALENNTAVADRYATQQILLGSIRTVPEVIAEIKAVKAEDVLRVSADMFNLSRLRIGVISPQPELASKAFHSLTKV